MDPKSITSHCAEQALRERVKELTCLYSIAQISGKPTSSLDEILQGIVNVLPAAWQFPETAFARILLDDNVYMTGRWMESPDCQQVPIVVRGIERGLVEVGYTQSPESSGDNVFLLDEQRLLDEVARQLSLIIDRRETAAEQERLHAKLRHADRLATIGQLAAGVAHELNEPLGGILGFAQLLAKTPCLPHQAQKDIQKIETAALHARETIRCLLTFARQTPLRDVQININRLIEDSAGIWGSRCEAEGVRVQYAFDENIPEVVADDGQIRQVVTNLAVNAVQAMPEGGTLRIETALDDDWIQFCVIDTGNGIAPEILPHVFDPFFTTKDIDQGTGLGLSVVHGIISGHGGRIFFDSTLGRGTRVKVRLPVHRLPDQANESGGTHV